MSLRRVHFVNLGEVLPFPRAGHILDKSRHHATKLLGIEWSLAMNCINGAAFQSCFTSCSYVVIPFHEPVVA